MLKSILLFLMILLAPVPWLVASAHWFVLKKKSKVILRILLIGLILWALAAYAGYETFPKIFTVHFDHFLLKIIGMVSLLVALGIELATQKELGTYRLMGSSELKKRKDKLVTSGIYKYARHPRYVEHPLWFLGLGLLTGYSVLLWFTLYLFLALWITSYFEEKELMQRYGRNYSNYKKRTPALFIPSRPHALFILLLFLHAAHIVEEVIGNAWFITDFYGGLLSFLIIMTTLFFLSFFVFYFFLRGHRWAYYGSYLYGIILVVNGMDHVVEYFISSLPGIITSIGLIIVGLIFLYHLKYTVIRSR
ncbi:MAG TPA: isoprenylcysteine carboxylmethyltransferase family protein [Candidatus Nanoarchaeia archaeon]|nr:isoprenylcysteine carboxylmethyltransferase family protein [Candidatus Nanoarchaeia archaeon]